jgi:hypothetical protein
MENIIIWKLQLWTGWGGSKRKLEPNTHNERWEVYWQKWTIEFTEMFVYTKWDIM